MVEHFHGKEGVASSILALGSIDRFYVLLLNGINSMKRLELKKDDRKVTGLCAGVADYFDIDTTIVRVAVLAATILTGFGPGILFYLIASVIVPKEGSYHA